MADAGSLVDGRGRSDASPAARILWDAAGLALSVWVARTVATWPDNRAGATVAQFRAGFSDALEQHRERKLFARTVQDNLDTLDITEVGNDA